MFTLSLSLSSFGDRYKPKSQGNSFLGQVKTEDHHDELIYIFQMKIIQNNETRKVVSWNSNLFIFPRLEKRGKCEK